MQENSGAGLIKDLVKEVMAAKGLSQQDLSDLTGSSLSRVKAITSGRVAKLKPEEIRALVEELHVSADWLATGVGPMFRPLPQEEDQDQFVGRMRAINTLSAVIDTLQIAQRDKDRFKLLLTGDPANDAATLAKAMGAELKPDEAALLDNYRHSPPEGQNAIQTTSAALAKHAFDNGDRKKSA